MKKIIFFSFLSLYLPFSLEGKPIDLAASASNEMPSLLMPVITTASILGLGFTLWTQVNPRLSLFEEISFARYARNVTQAPRWDHDRLEFNFIGHPAWGAETYLLARNRGFDPWVAFLFSAGASVLWEYGFEAFAERPSIQDLILTPVIGSALGEMRFQVKSYFLALNHKNPFWIQSLLIVLLDPVEALVGLIKGPSGSAGKKISIQVDLNPKFDLEKISLAPKIQLSYFF